MPRRAIIVGAGVAGVTAAIALSQAGFRVAIYERTNTLDEFGAGLQITPNATRVLARLGVLERVLPLALRPRAVVVLRGSDNAELMRMSLDGAEGRWGAAYLVIHRADLQRALLDAVRGHSGVELTLGATVLDFKDDGRRISVGLARGMTQTRDEADLLIGADGLRSQVRDQLGFGALDRAAFSGHVAYSAPSTPIRLILGGGRATSLCASARGASRQLPLASRINHQFGRDRQLIVPASRGQSC